MARVDGHADARRRAHVEPTPGHIRGLDGIRALSVLAIIAFHSGLSWIPGGYYGVDAFFALSGFLITTLLLGEWGASGTIGLRRFWGRRARRLLPALFLLVAVIGVVMATLPGVFSRPHAFENALCDGVLLVQLVPDPRRCVLLLALEPAVAVGPHLVTGYRGAVLFGVAHRPPRRARLRDRTWWSTARHGGIESGSLSSDRRR